MLSSSVTKLGKPPCMEIDELLCARALEEQILLATTIKSFFEKKNKNVEAAGMKAPSKPGLPLKRTD